MSTSNENKKKIRYHGQVVVDDLIPVKGKDVLEVNSNCDVVLRCYDENGNSNDYPLPVNIFISKKDPTPSDILRDVRKQVGNRRFLISQSAVDLIEKFAEK